MKTIYIYTGNGAYQAKDIEFFLAVFGYDYIRLSEYDLGQLTIPGLLIMPGGQIDAYLSAWGSNGIKFITDFVRSGGIYIGICSGVYVAGKSYNKTAGLNFFDKELQRFEHQSVIDVQDSTKNKYQLIAENGPVLVGIDAGEIMLADNKGQAQAIRLRVGKGLAILFASHPEGSIFYNQPPQTFSGARYFDLLLNDLLK